MALKACRECGALVSTEAEICPHCGVKSPIATSPMTPGGHGRLLVILLIVGGIILVSMMSQQNTGSSSNDPEKYQLTLCKSDFTHCADNEQLVNNYAGWAAVKSDCKMAANEQAQYGTPVWPWLSFGRFYKGDDYLSGKAVAIETDAQFQNGFGAMVHSRVICTYDLREKRVISVNIFPK